MVTPGPDADRRRRLRLVVLLGLFTAFGSLSIDVYLPSLPSLARELHASVAASQLTLTSFLVGFALGQVGGGSVSDRFGRRRPALWALSGYALATVGCALAPSLAVLCVLRLFQGLLAGTLVVVARAVVRDLYYGVEAARLYSLLMLIMGAMPMLGPLVGSQLLHLTNWRGVFAATAATVGVVTVVSALQLPETLAHDARRRSGIGLWASTVHGLAADRVFVGYLLAGGVAVGGMFAWIGGSAFVVQHHYGLSPQGYGIVFGILSCGFMGGGQLNRRLVRYVSLRRMLVAGYGLQLSGAAAALAVFASPHAGIAVLVPAMVAVFAGVGIILPNTLALALEHHASEAGVAAGLVGVVQYGVGATMAPLVGLAGAASGVPVGVAIVSCAVTGFLAFGVLARPTVEAPADHVVVEARA
jgi:DHA1 family bicyclomycin/chloramphenicol resistance-like MFS transporter